MTEQALKALLESMTLEEKAGQLVQCNAGQFVANELAITGPDGELLPTEDLCRVMGSVLTFEDAKQATFALNAFFVIPALLALCGVAVWLKRRFA